MIAKLNLVPISTSLYASLPWVGFGVGGGRKKEKKRYPLYSCLVTCLYIQQLYNLVKKLLLDSSLPNVKSPHYVPGHFPPLSPFPPPPHTHTHIHTHIHTYTPKVPPSVPPPLPILISPHWKQPPPFVPSFVKFNFFFFSFFFFFLFLFPRSSPTMN